MRGFPAVLAITLLTNASFSTVLGSMIGSLASDSMQVRQVTRRDRLSAEVRAETLVAFKGAAETLESLAHSAIALERTEEWWSLTARLAILCGKLMAGEGGDELVTASEAFVKDYLSFIEAARSV